MLPALLLTCCDSIDGKPIEVIVGGNLDKHSFYVHEAILQQSSSYLKTALNKKWKEGKTRVIKLPEVNAEVFKSYLQWLYTGRTCCMPVGGDLLTYDSAVLAELYVLGEKLMDFHLQQRVIDAFVVAGRGPLAQLPSRYAIYTLYAGTPVIRVTSTQAYGRHVHSAWDR